MSDPILSLVKQHAKNEAHIDRLMEKVKPREEIDWATVDIIVEGYRDRHEFEFLGCLELVKKQRASLINKFGEISKDSAMRHLYEMPPRLIKALEMVYPDVLKEKNLITFLKRHPYFRVAEVL